jgi:hypothetical protein
MDGNVGGLSHCLGWVVIESRWSQLSSKCQRCWHPPRPNKSAAVFGQVVFGRVSAGYDEVVNRMDGLGSKVSLDIS